MVTEFKKHFYKYIFARILNSIKGCSPRAQLSTIYQKYVRPPLQLSYFHLKEWLGLKDEWNLIPFILHFWLTAFHAQYHEVLLLRNLLYLLQRQQNWILNFGEQREDGTCPKLLRLIRLTFVTFIFTNS